MITNTQLFRIATYGAVGLSVTSVVVYFSFQRRVRETAIYKESMQALLNNEKAINYLGPPVTEGKVKIGEYDDNLRWFSVRLMGSKVGGKLFCDFIPNVGDVKPSKIRRVEVQFDDRPGINYVIKENKMEEEE